MKQIFFSYCAPGYLGTFALILCLNLSGLALAKDQDKWEFWSSQRSGTNFFNQNERFDRMDAAKKLGVSFIRLTPTKWKTAGSGGNGTFLFGNFDKYEGLVEPDYLRLKEVLDYAAKIDLKVVITFLSVHGRVWNQHYSGQEKHDLRLWRDEAYRKHLAAFWRELSSRLRDHPAVVGYNIINEPDPEHADPTVKDWYGDDHREWCNRSKAGLLDLNKLYNEVIKAIRDVDSNTPIVVDSGYMGVPLSTLCFDRLADNKVLYSFHMYEPYDYTLANRKHLWKYAYPGSVPIGDLGKETPLWNLAQLENFLGKISMWQVAKGISSKEVYVGEFGVLRRNPGAASYISDLINVFDKNNWHWSFYSFREDTWDAVDYELGGRKHLPASYWDAVERGEDPYLLRLPFYQTSAVFDVIKAKLKH